MHQHNFSTTSLSHLSQVVETSWAQVRSFTARALISQAVALLEEIAGEKSLGYSYSPSSDGRVLVTVCFRG